MTADVGSDFLTPRLLLGMRQELEAAAAAMDATLRQGAGSPAIGRHESTAAGFYSAAGVLVSGGRQGQPLLLEAAAEAVTCLVRQHAAAGRAFATGDLYWTNDPRCDAAGLEDLVIASPMVRDDRLLGFVALTASHTGLGRATLAPVESLRREGLALPWTRVGRAGAIHEEILEFLAANAEEPAALLEDLRVHVHALRLGQVVIEGIADRMGPGALASVWEALAGGGRSALAKLLGRLEGGTTQGRVPPFAVRITREAQRAAVSIEVDGNARCPLPSPALARAAVRAAFREVLVAEAPAVGVLGGWADAIRIEGPWDPPQSHLPMGPARHFGAQGLSDAVLAAFAEALPHLAHTPDAGCVLLDLRGLRADGRRYRMRLDLGTGLGASVFGDGMTHAAPPFQPQHLCPAEEIERAVPLRVLRFALRPDSAGPGQYRGGLGALVELELLEGRAQVDVLLPGTAAGLRGGMKGAGARLVHWTSEEGMREEAGSGRFTLLLRAGHRLLLESPGGGGWGIPFQRSILRIEEDLVRGLITPDQSKNRYGVVLKPGSLEKDDHLTYRLRHFLLTTLTAEDIIAGEELLD